MESTTRERKKRIVAPREQVREWILNATARVLEESGYGGMTMADVARSAGVGKGTLYLHFASKEDLVLAHVDQIVEDVLKRMRLILDMPLPPTEKLYRMLLARIMIRFDAVVPYGTSLSDLLREVRDGLMERRRRHFEREGKLLSEVLGEGREEGSFRLDNSSGTAALLITATNSLLPYGLSPRELGNRDEVEATASGLAQFLVAACQAGLDAS